MNVFTAGLISLAIGISGVIFFVSSNFINTAIINESSTFIGKYSIVLVLCLCALHFLLQGVLFLAGYLVPYNLANTKYEKTKSSLFSAFFALMACFFVSFVVFEFSSKIEWKIGWILLMLGLSASILVNFFNLKKYKAGHE